MVAEREGETLEWYLEDYKLDPPDWGIPRAPRGPTLDEMKATLKSHLQASHPEWLKSDVQREFDSRGWTLIFTPPYCPKFQPIELFWQHGKGFVAREYQPSRSMKIIKEQIRTGWYGGEDSNKDPHAAADCSKLIEHCLKAAREALENDEMLTGKLGHGLELTSKGLETEPDLIHNTLCFANNDDDDEDDDTFFVEDDCDEEIDEESDDE